MSADKTAPPIGETTLIHRTNTVLTAAVGKEIVMMDIDSGRYLGLDDIGSVIWQRLETPCTFGALVSQVWSVAGPSSRARTRCR